MNSTGSTEPENYWGGRGGGRSQLVFFFLISLFVLFFFQNKVEPFCLTAPDTDCVHTEVTSCTRVGVRLLRSLVLFKLLGEGGEREGSARQQRQFSIILSSFFSSIITGLCTSEDNSSFFGLNLSGQPGRRKQRTAPF